MNAPSDNDPATPEDPVSGGLREVLQCFSDWLDTKAPSNEKSYRILKALTSESLKKAGRDASQRRFHADEITAAMGEDEPWTHSLGHNEWLDWNNTVQRFVSQQESELQDFARQRGLKLYPSPQRNSTRGGPGNKATYEIVGKPIPTNVSADELAPDNIIRYISVSPSAIRPAWFLRGVFRDGEIHLTHWKRLVLICVFVGLVLLAFLLSFMAYLGLMEPRPVTTREIANLIGMIGIPLTAWLWVIRPFTRLLSDRIVLASDLILAIDEHPAQLELYKADDVRVIRFTRYMGNCLICGAEVQMDSGEPDYPRRLVGRCLESPREHVFSFDRVNRKGRVLRGGL